MFTIPGKIPITINPLFWLVALFIAFMSTTGLAGLLLAVVVIVFSVLVHECGHAFVALLFGQKARIELAAFGGFTYREGRKLKLWEEFLVVLAGPLAGFLLFLVARAALTLFSDQTGIFVFMLKYAALVNLFWTVINLIPVLPLDGGHLLSIILEGIFGFRGVKIAIVTSLCISIAAAAFFFVIGRFFVGALFLILMFECFKSLRYYKIFKEKDRDVELQNLVKEADEDLQKGQIEVALKKLQEVRERAQAGILYTVATQEMADIYYQQQRYDEAYALLQPIQSALAGETLSLFHFLAYANHDYETVTKIGSQCYQQSPTYQTALINAYAHGVLSQVEPAVGWLECAYREGAPSLKEAISKKEFDPIREDRRFQEFTATL